jgi:hypothetical protein
LVATNARSLPEREIFTTGRPLHLFGQLFQQTGRNHDADQAPEQVLYDIKSANGTPMPNAVGTALCSSLPVDVPMLPATLPQSNDIPHAASHTSTNQMQGKLSLAVYNKEAYFGARCDEKHE